MKNTTVTTPQELTVKREIRIGGTLFNVTSIYKGQQELDQVLLNWAVKKALSSADC